MKKLGVFSILIPVLILPAAAMASSSNSDISGAEWERRLGSDLRRASNACGGLSDSQMSSDGDEDDEDGWELRRFFLGVSPSWSVTIPGVFDLKVTPHLEFVWEKVDLEQEPAPSDAAVGGVTQ